MSLHLLLLVLQGLTALASAIVAVALSIAGITVAWGWGLLVVAYILLQLLWWLRTVAGDVRGWRLAIPGVAMAAIAAQLEAESYPNASPILGLYVILWSLADMLGLRMERFRWRTPQLGPDVNRRHLRRLASPGTADDGVLLALGSRLRRHLGGPAQAAGEAPIMDRYRTTTMRRETSGSVRRAVLTFVPRGEDDPEIAVILELPSTEQADAGLVPRVCAIGDTEVLLRDVTARRLGVAADALEVVPVSHGSHLVQVRGVIVPRETAGAIEDELFDRFAIDATITGAPA